MPAGYSSTPLAKKLGIKPGFSIKLVGVPAHYFSLFTDLPENLLRDDSTGSRKNFIHFFTTSAAELFSQLPKLKGELKQDGILWVSWPKKSSKMATDIDENIIRDKALATGLVDIKVCAVDDMWSGLKLVIPVKDRKA